MEEYSFSFPEYQVLKKNRARLEKCFDVRICLPNIRGKNQSPPVSVTIKIGGEPRNVKYVKKFLKREMSKKTESKSESPESIPVITIDDEVGSFSEATSTTSKIEEEIIEVPSTCASRNEEEKIEVPSTCSSRNEEEIIEVLRTCASRTETITSTFSSAKQNIVSEFSETSNASSSSGSSAGGGSSKSPESNQDADDSIVILSEVIVSSTSPNKPPKKVSKWPKKALNKDSKPLPDFLPLRTRNVPLRLSKKRKANALLPVPKERRVLRPIVIDGSNVARFHGKPTNTFSCKGIKICVDHFLKRGHTDIKVLLPQFKRYMSYGNVITTDGEILDELEKSNMVVYTPSRRVNERRITCYDDRFIVSLASQNNGVIVSNDNYRDIMMESIEFKKTIDERLLMFCFAGDILMIPEDPLGVNGPTLTEFLSMRV